MGARILFPACSCMDEDLFRHVKKFPTRFYFLLRGKIIAVRFFLLLRMYLSSGRPFDYAQGGQPKMSEKADRLKSPRLI